MWLRAPQGCTGLSYEGRTYHVGSDGLIDVDDRLVGLFLTQGFTPCAGDEPRQGATNTSDLPNIDALDRRALFALLREKNVRVRLPITNAALRDAARQALHAPTNDA
jgi:hypothetical protein